jgi:hypothetical protein
MCAIFSNSIVNAVAVSVFTLIPLDTRARLRAPVNSNFPSLSVKVMEGSETPEIVNNFPTVHSRFLSKLFCQDCQLFAD